QEGGGEAPAVVREDRPALARLVPCCLDHSRAEPDVTAQVEAIGDVLEIREDLRLGRVALGPGPLLLQLVRPRVGVGHALDVAARPGVPFPDPGSADAGGLVDDEDGQAERAQAMEQVEAGDACADDDGVVTAGLGHGLRAPRSAAAASAM